MEPDFRARESRAVTCSQRHAQIGGIGRSSPPDRLGSCREPKPERPARPSEHASCSLEVALSRPASTPTHRAEPGRKEGSLMPRTLVQGLGFLLGLLLAYYLLGPFLEAGVR